MDFVGLLSSLVSLFQVFLLVRAVLSMMPGATRSGTGKGIYDLLVSVTEPVLRPIRRTIPPVGGTVDLSPVVAVLLLSLVMSLIIRL